MIDALLIAHFSVSNTLKEKRTENFNQPLPQFRPLEPGYRTSCIHSLLFVVHFNSVDSTSNSNWLRAGRPKGQSSSPGRVNNFLFSTASRPALGHTHFPIQWVSGVISLEAKRPGREADNLLRTNPGITASVIQRSEFLATDPEVRVRFPALPDFLRSSGSGTGSTQPREYNWWATWKKK
jgi:hypothetical protein